MSQPDIGKLMQQAQQMQARMSELQRELAATRFESEAGGGMVKVVVSGELRVLEVEIEPSLLREDDRAMVQDLTAAAVNAALSKAQTHAQQKMQQLSMGGLKLPDFMNPQGGGG
jgi:DNA-binding YbaB/EbfC family protein